MQHKTLKFLLGLGAWKQKRRICQSCGRWWGRQNLWAHSMLRPECDRWSSPRHHIWGPCTPMTWKQRPRIWSPSRVLKHCLSPLSTPRSPPGVRHPRVLTHPLPLPPRWRPCAGPPPPSGTAAQHWPRSWTSWLGCSNFELWRRESWVMAFIWASVAAWVEWQIKRWIQNGFLSKKQRPLE